MKEYSFIVPEKLNNIKAIDFLSLSGISSEIIQKVKFGGVIVNQKTLTNINDRLFENDIVKIVLPPDTINPYIKKIKGDLEILYEDEYFLAVFKEKGVLTHSSKNNKLSSLEELVLGYLDCPYSFRPINRLDRDTSGIVLIAKDMLTASFLNKQMKDGLIKKSYYTIINGCPKENHFFIEKPIKRLSPQGMKRGISEDGQYAKTECKVIKTFKDKTLLEVFLHTGRTHQIRVHLSSIGYPLYADELYGEKIENEKYFLCAKKLCFLHPFLNKQIEISIEDKILKTLNFI